MIRRPHNRVALLAQVVGLLAVSGASAQIIVSNQALSATRVSPPRFDSAQRDLLRAIGTRLQIPGKERQTAVATFTRPSGSSGQNLTSVVTITYQLPGMLRISDPTQNQITMFNGTQLSKEGGSVGTTDEDAVESLAYLFSLMVPGCG
jgi:hypothetical protein